MAPSSTMRVLIALAVAALLTTTPASAQEDPSCPEGQTETPEGCSQQAWVDDCPPDMMCAYDTPDNGTDYDAPPQFTTCMDGVDEGEECDDTLIYMTGPQAPAENSGGNDTGGDQKDAPGAPAALAAVLLLGVVAVVAGFRRV